MIFHGTHDFFTKATLSHTPYLSPKPKLHQAPWWLKAIHFTSFDPFRLHHIVGFIKTLSKPWYLQAPSIWWRQTSVVLSCIECDLQKLYSKTID